MDIQKNLRLGQLLRGLFKQGVDFLIIVYQFLKSLQSHYQLIQLPFKNRNTFIDQLKDLVVTSKKQIRKLVKSLYEFKTSLKVMA